MQEESKIKNFKKIFGDQDERNFSVRNTNNEIMVFFIK